VGGSPSTPAPELPPFPAALANAGPVVRIDMHRIPAGVMVRVSSPGNPCLGILTPTIAEALRILARAAENGCLD
jgi:hypothetical protein